MSAVRPDKMARLELNLHDVYRVLGTSTSAKRQWRILVKHKCTLTIKDFLVCFFYPLTGYAWPVPSMEVEWLERGRNSRI